MYTIHTNCRACGYGPPRLPGCAKAAASSDRLVSVFSLGVQPLANDFRSEDEERAGFAPLEVLFCPQCGLAQLSVVVKPEILYASYPYVTSKSVMMHDHFKRLWDDCSKLAVTKNVLEIGSNDGDFLVYCKANGAEQVVGVEPAENLADQATKKGILTIRDFFSLESAKHVTQQMPKVGIMFARHVFCHIDDWQRFMVAVASIADQDTILCIEIPYVVDLLNGNQFDTIYHEHTSYLSIRSMKALLSNGPFHLRKILHYDIHGGAIVLVIQRDAPSVAVHQTVSEYLEREVTTEQVWKEFQDRCHHLISDLASYIKGIALNGGRVVGYGASAKSTVWINAMGLTHHELKCVYDCTPEKWYRFIPGTQIPVVPEGGFYVDNPDYAVCFSWNFFLEIKAKQQKWLTDGGKWILPVPKLRVIGLDSDTGAE